MSVIITKYLGPTNHRGGRIKASITCGWGKGSLILPYDYALSGRQNHTAAARALALRFKTVGEFDSTATTDGYLFIPKHLLTRAFELTPHLTFA